MPKSMDEGVPWQVSLSNPMEHHFCSGVILDHTTVVSSASCFKRSKDKTSVSVKTSTESIPAKELILNTKDQIAVLKLAVPLDLNKVQPICMPRNELSRSSNETRHCFYTSIRDDGTKLQFSRANPDQSQRSFSLSDSNMMNTNAVGGPLICIEDDLPVLAGIVDQIDTSRSMATFVSLPTQSLWVDELMVTSLSLF